MHATPNVAISMSLTIGFCDQLPQKLILRYLNVVGISHIYTMYGVVHCTFIERSMQQHKAIVWISLSETGDTVTHTHIVRYNKMVDAVRCNNVIHRTITAIYFIWHYMIAAPQKKENLCDFERMISLPFLAFTLINKHIRRYVDGIVHKLSSHDKQHICPASQ